MTTVLITQIPLLNSVVIKQRDGHLFIAAPDSFIIDKQGYLSLLYKLLEIGFLQAEDISAISARIGLGNENEKNSSNTD